MFRRRLREDLVGVQFVYAKDINTPGQREEDVEC